MTELPEVDELTEENIEHLVIQTPKGYEWVYGLSGSFIDGRAVTPQETRDGDVEMVVEMGSYYSRPVDALVDDALAVIGKAVDMEEAQDVVRKHRQK